MTWLDEGEVDRRTQAAASLLSIIFTARILIPSV